MLSVVMAEGGGGRWALPPPPTVNVVGGCGGGVTPGPIPNPEAKPSSADGTALVRVWESRSPPTFLSKRPDPFTRIRPLRMPETGGVRPTTRHRQDRSVSVRSGAGCPHRGWVVHSSAVPLALPTVAAAVSMCGPRPIAAPGPRRRTMFDTQVTVVGNVATAVKGWALPNGDVVAKFRIASTARWRSQAGGEWVDGSSLFVQVTCWRQLAENVIASLGVGDPVVVRGRLYTDEFEWEGKRQTATRLEAHAVGPDLSRCKA